MNHKTKEPLMYLGDLLGSLRYLGSCHECRVQFMSTGERVTKEGVCKNCNAKRPGPVEVR